MAGTARIDLETKAGPYVVSFEGVSGGHAVTATTTITIKPRVFATKTLIVDDAFCESAGPMLARITDEAAALNRLWTQSTPSRLSSDGFERPVPGQVNGAFGTRSIFNGERRQPHGGADFRSPAGTPVVHRTAAASCSPAISTSPATPWSSIMGLESFHCSRIGRLSMSMRAIP